MPRPKCFDSDAQWDEWNRRRREARENVSYCRDCLPERRENMVKEGRCEFPAVAFVIAREGDIVGLRPDECGWFGAVTGFLKSKRKKMSTKVCVALGSAESIMMAMRKKEFE